MGNMTFDEFVDFYKRERANGHIKLTLKGKETKLTMLDLAVTFVIGIFWNSGIKTITENDLAIQIPLFCGADIETLEAIEVA